MSLLLLNFIGTKKNFKFAEKEISRLRTHIIFSTLITSSKGLLFDLLLISYTTLK